MNSFHFNKDPALLQSTQEIAENVTVGDGRLNVIGTGAVPAGI